MSNPLIHHLRKYIAIDAADEDLIVRFFKPRFVHKKERIVEQGDKFVSHFFVEKGCLRMYFTSQKGIDQTNQFAIENWWMTDYFAFENQSQSGFTIQALEDGLVYEINYQNQEKLLEQFPQLERYFRIIFQRAYSASQLRLKYLTDFSRTEFYEHFNSNFPEFTQRIPQHLLASYLQMTPEYLSEIKKKLLS